MVAQDRDQHRQAVRTLIRVLLAVGSAPCVYDDVVAAKALHPDAELMLINGACVAFADAEHVLAGHTAKAEEFARARREAFPNAAPWRLHAARYTRKQPEEAKYPSVTDWWDGSHSSGATSAGKAAMIGLSMGFDKIILCGARRLGYFPGESVIGAPIKHEAACQRIGDASKQRASTIRRYRDTMARLAKTTFKGKVFSMSGFTREVLGGAMIVNALGKQWSWPPSDVKCRQVVFDWSKDLAIVYQHCKNFRTAIQAGGNMGVWPWLLAKKFATVVTAEPETECLFHLRENLRNVRNVTILPYALGESAGVGSIRYVPGNLGAQWVEPGDDVEIVTIDSMARANVDLIYLDIEGFEMAALRGARETITRDKPTIVVEDKGLSEKFGYKKGDIEKWLGAEFGYKVVARPHRDVVMTCEF